MRYRKPPNHIEKLNAYERYLSQENAASRRGKWRELFDNTNEKLVLEIGCGKGGFLIEQSRRNPDCNFIGIERTPSLVLEALHKIEADKRSNILFAGLNAQWLEEFFEQGEVDRLYLNFSDPWPKNRNAKRRLTSGVFLRRYRNILSGEQEIVFKTDNKALFEFTIMEISANEGKITSIDIDLHAKNFPEEDERLILTEYEKRFMERGLPIFRLEAHLKGKA